MKGSSKSGYSLKDFRLLFKPRSFFFFKKNNTRFRIYLEKDVQVIGTVDQLIPPIAPNIKYALSQFNRPIEFRVVTGPIANYTISLYEVQASGEEQIVENSELKFSKFLEEYYQEFMGLDEQVGIELKSKEPSPLHQIWKNLSNNFTKKVLNASIRFKNIDAILQFVIEPVHHYDQIVKQAELIEQKKRQRKENYFKSKTIPENASKEEVVSLKRGYTQHEALLKPFSFQTLKDTFEKANIKESLKQFSITIPQPKNKEHDKGTPTNQETSHTINDSNQAVHEQFKKKTKRVNVDLILEKNEQDQQQQSKPVPRVEHPKYLMMAESKNSNLPKVLKQDIQTDQKNSLKDKLIALIALLSSFFFVFILMHPLSKT